MPIYSFSCPKCGFIRDELRKMGDTNSPNCVYCDIVMDRVFTPVSTVLKGQGWSHGSQEKIRTRSREQGKKFFKRHPDKLDYHNQYVDSVPK